MRRSHKITVLLLAALGLTIGLLWAGRPPQDLPLRPDRWQEDLAALRRDFGDQNLPATGLLTMTAPEFVGQDKAGGTWRVTAAQAIQIATTEAGNDVAAEVRLAQPEATVVEADGQTMTLRAGQAVYQPNTQVLTLTQTVVLRYTALTLTLGQLAYDFAQRQGVGAEGVKLEGPFGFLTAPRLAIQQGGATLRLTGGVKGRLLQRKGQR